MFPTENSLVGLDPLIANLKRKIGAVDREILAAVQQQSSTGSRSRQDLSRAREAMAELTQRMADIRRKAEASEAMVQEICRDIRKLDRAKGHLQVTITSLRRLAMLVDAVDKLQQAAERAEFGECAQLLEAVQQLATNFEEYSSIPKIAELRGRVAALQASLKTACMREFELLGVGDEAPSPQLLATLHDCCLVIDALGFKAREELVDAICKKESRVYQQIFAVTSALERAEARFSWLKKRVKGRGDVWGVFPPHWHLPQLVALACCSITKAQLAEALSLAPNLGSQVEALLFAVKSTNDFEADMARHFSGGQSDEGEEEEGGSNGYGGDDTATASQVRKHYERKFRDRLKNEESEKNPAAAKRTSDPANLPTPTPFQGSISSVFTPYLQVYVDKAEQELHNTLDGLLREETWAPMEDAGDTHVLHSASALFAALKHTLGQCSKNISKGGAMLELMRAFQRVLSTYAARLTGRLPRTAAGTRQGPATVASTEWHVRMDDNEAAVMCNIICTAEYCQTCVGDLGRFVAKILTPSLGEKVDVNNEEEKFQDVVTAGLTMLILGIETSLDKALQEMVRMPWATIESVGDQSPFVSTCAQALSGLSTLLPAALSPGDWTYTCDKLAASFCPRFHDSVFRCRKLSQAGSQQLLLDTQAVKALLLSFPSAGKSSQGPSAALQGYVGREMGKVEALLKVVGSRPENLVDNFATLMPTGNAADFQRILDIKVLKRQEQQTVSDAFSRRMSRTAGGALTAGASGSYSTPFPRMGNAPTAPSIPQGAQAGFGRTASGAASGPHSGHLAPLATKPLSRSGSAAPASLLPAASASSAGLPPPSAAQDMGTRFRFGANTAAARASAAAAGERMRETMAGSLAAMKNLNLGFARREQT
ncbi:hypothetical protein WJX73_001616 [Symbiochloris irregularis]|uniref:Vps53 N-terminal domain-containing protein n=1 Tax=Symbiochloris irregularis TaxID=706552 RepID=A0AAW1NMB0_9CHLO